MKLLENQSNLYRTVYVNFCVDCIRITFKIK
jgi:hypothetical protein